MGRRKQTCAMCETRRAKPLTATAHDGSTYTYGENVNLFCSVTCAANWALVFATEYPLGKHWCPSDGKWVYCEKNYCPDCQEPAIVDEDHPLRLRGQ